MENNERANQCSQEIKELLMKKGFEETKGTGGDLEYTLSGGEVVQFLKNIGLENSSIKEIKIRMVKNSDECYLPKYEVGVILHGTVVNTKDDAENFINRLSV